MEERLLLLEQSVAAMKTAMQKERMLLRKAVLIQLDMGDVYEDTLQ
jgi:general secretion pathway protein A